MRILLINSEYPPVGGGAGNASQQIAQRLAEMGHEILVVTSGFAGLPAQEQFAHLTVRRIPALRRRQDRSGALEQIIFILSASFWVLRWLPHFRPQATLAFFGVPSGAVALLLKMLFHIPYVVSLRGGDVPGFRPYDFRVYHKLLAPVLRSVWKNASAIVANSTGLRDLALAFDARFAIPIISNGVDLNGFKREQRDWSAPRLLSVGRLVYQKGLDLGLRALAGLKHLDWHWDIAGDGPQLNTLKSLVADLALQERVTFLGWQSRQELVQLYRESSLFLFPSRHEGMPNAVLEAMASGLPVIASRIAGNEELVLDGETGLLVESENVQALRRALQTLLVDADLREQMGCASRRRVEQQYSWEHTARQYALLFEKVK